MARLHNVLPSTLLVLVGAWAGAGHTPSVLCSGSVWLMAAVSSGVSAASMVVNDYFDYLSGTDRVNSPDKPIPSGRISPDVAVLFGALVYMLVLISACTMKPHALRMLIAASAAATMAYTPLLKRCTLVKNVVVAGVIASAPIAGGLAARMDSTGLMRLLAPAAFVFGGVMYREILMDINDVEGDGAAGIRTLPVVAGPRVALNTATASAVACAGAALAALWLSAAPQVAAAGAAGGSLAGALTWARVLGCAALVVASTGRLVALDVGVRRAGWAREALDRAVDECRVPIGLGTILLAAAIL